MKRSSQMDQFVKSNVTSVSKRLILVSALFALAATLIACSPQVNYHGHVFAETDIQQVKPGMSKEQVRLAFGTPDTQSAIGGETYYYISSTHKHVTFLKPKVVDRKVVAVYFTPSGEVKRVAHYGLKDGKIFDFISRTTPSHGSTDSILTQLFRNLGQGQTFGGQAQ